MYILPEIFISITSLYLLIASLKKVLIIKIYYFSLAIILLPNFILKDIFYYEEIFTSFFIVDSFSSFIKLLILICSGFIIYFLYNCQKPYLSRKV